MKALLQLIGSIAICLALLWLINDHDKTKRMIAIHDQNIVNLQAEVMVLKHGIKIELKDIRKEIRAEN